MSQGSEQEMEERLRAAGKSLLQPPSAFDELLSLLDQTEVLLSKVEQSPGKSTQTALAPLMKALIKEKLLKHSDVDIRVGVASCISEITRITAPEAPYDDDRMKDVFQLIVSSFENISDTSSRSHEKRATILETVAKVRSCVIMLDLECDEMIIEMFQHFLKAIRDDHTEIVFSSMETIMTLVIEESEDITPELLNPILTTLKRNNEDAMPIAKKLAERVVQSCADKLRPYLAQAIKTLGASFDDYNEAVASLFCENGTAGGHSNENTLNDQLVVKDGTKETSPNDKIVVGNRSPKSTVTNGVNETGTEETMTDANYTTKTDTDDLIDGKTVSKTEPDDMDAQIPAKAEAEVEHAAKTKVRQFNSNSDTEESSNPHVDEKQAEQGPPDQEISGEDAPSVPSEGPHVESVIASDKVEVSTIPFSPSEAQADEDVNVSSPTRTDSPPEQNRSKKAGSAKRKEILVSEGAVSGDTASEKVARGENMSVAKKQRSSLKKKLNKTTIKDIALTGEGDCKNDGGNTSDSEKKPQDQTEKLDDAGNGSDAGSPARKGDGKTSGRSKSSSEKRPLDQTENLDDAGNESDAGSPAKKGGGKTSGRSKSRSEKRSLDQTEDDAGNESDAGSPAKKGVGKKSGSLKHKPGKKSVNQTVKLDRTGNESDAGSPTRKRDGKKSARSKYKSEKRSLDQMEKLKDAGTESDAGSPARKGDGKKSGLSKNRAGKKPLDETEEHDAGNESDVGSPERKGDGKKSSRSKYRSEKRPLDQTEKLDDGGNESDIGSPARKRDVKKSRSSKFRSGKDVLKSSIKEDDEKDTVTSPRSPLKSTKDETINEETPKTSLKRNRTPGTEKASDTTEYGKNLVGSKVKVWWPKDRMFYEGVIASFDSARKKHKVSYADGDEEVLNLKKERWEFVGDDSVSDEDQAVERSSPDTSADMPRKKKGKSSEAPSKHVKMEGSSKSKSKDTATKSGGKFRDDEKAEANTKASNSKTSRKSEDDSVKIRQKPGGKSRDDSAKDDVAKTPSHSKQDSQRTAKATSKTPQSGKTSGGLAKSGQSKVKESNKTKEKTVDSTKSAEMSKGKSPAAAKSRESESKSAKKRKR